MSDDTKLDFYLKHRQQIEEWAALREGAKRSLDAALLAAVTAKAQTEPSLLQVAVTGVRNVRWRVPGAQYEPVWIELYWNPGLLLKGTADSAWPYLALVVSEKAPSDNVLIRTRIKEATRGPRTLCGLTEEGTAATSWVWSGPVVPAQEPVTIDGYVDLCLQRFERTWTQLHPVILRAVQELPHTT